MTSEVRIGRGAAARATGGLPQTQNIRKENDRTPALFGSDDPDDPVDRLLLWAREKLSPEDQAALEDMLVDALNHVTNVPPSQAAAARGGVDRRMAGDAATVAARQAASRSVIGVDAATRKTFGAEAGHVADLERRLDVRLPRQV